MDFRAIADGSCKSRQEGRQFSFKVMQGQKGLQAGEVPRPGLGRPQHRKPTAMPVFSWPYGFVRKPLTNHLCRKNPLCLSRCVCPVTRVYGMDSCRSALLHPVPASSVSRRPAGAGLFKRLGMDRSELCRIVK